MKITASILDYSYPSLDPSVFDKELKLYQYQKDFVLRILDKMYATYDLLQPETWVEDVVLLGSLTTSKWLLSSDMDIHIRVNLDNFIKANMPSASKEEAYAKLDETRKLWDRAKILAPMTQHPIEAYFESLELSPSNTDMVGVYSLIKGGWLKAPILFEANLDLEESKKSVVEAAEALAQELDSSLGTIKRDIQRIDELETVIKAWDKDKQQLFYKKIETKLNNIEEEIIKDLKIKQDLVDERHLNQDATSDNELTFKYLQRYGFFGILQNLKKLLEQTGGTVTIQELPLIEKIISEGSIKEASNLNYAYWVDPQGKIYTVRPNEYSKDLFTHSDWVVANQDLLKEQYGLTLDLNCFKIIKEMYAAGWARIGDSGQSDMGYGITVGSLSHIPEGVDIALAQFYKGEELIVEGDSDHETVIIDDPFPSLQMAVNKALSQKRMGSLKQASHGMQYFLVPDGTAYPVADTSESHTGWLMDNVDILKQQYGLPENFVVKSANDVNKLWQFVQNLGWVRIADASRVGGAFNIAVMDINNIPPSVDKFISEKYQGGTIEIEDDTHDLIEISDPFPSIQKAVNRALSHKRLQTAALNKIYTRDELERRDIDTLDRMAYGHASGEIIQLKPSQIHIQYPVDLSNPEYKFEQKGMDWVKSVDFSEPIKVSIKQNGKFYLEDGHHRWFAAKKLGLPLMAEIEVKAKPIETILQRQKAANTEQNLHTSLKQAFLKEAFEEEKLVLAIDFDDTLAKENSDHTIGEPEPGAKEALIKLKNDGYTLEIYSHRANTKKGADEIKEWMEKYEIPYDSILNVEKPIATYYIDNRGIHFTNWADVLKQVEKSDKTASLHIVSRGEDVLWVAPDSKTFHVSEGSHFQWIQSHLALLKKYGIEPSSDMLNDDVLTDMWDRMIREGWIRVSDDYDDFIVDMYTIKNILPIIERIVINANPDSVTIEYLGGSVVLDREEYSQGLQKAVNRKLTQKLVHASKDIIAYNQQKLWIDPKGKEYKVPTAHADWILENQDMLKKQYGWKNTGNWKFEDGGEIYDYEGLDATLLNMGWSRVGDVYGGGGWGIEVADLFDVPDYLIDKLIGKHGTVTFESGSHWVSVDIDEFVTKGQKAVTRAYHSKRLQPAFCKKDLNKVAYERHGAYWVDPNGKVYPIKTTHEDWFFEQEDLLRTQYQYGQDEIGQDWWDIKTGNLLKQLLEDGWLRVGDLFAAGRKSIGTGIEIANLSSIPSTLIDFVSNWGKDKYFQIEDLQRRVVELSVEELMADGQEAINKALQQERMLSRRGSLSQKYWLDPQGRAFALDRKESHPSWILENLAELKRNYNIDVSVPYTQKIAPQMFQQGWVRVTSGQETSDRSDFAIEVADITNIPAYIDNFIASKYTGNGVEVSDLKNDYVKVDDPFPYIQDQVNKSLRQPVVASLDKKAGNVGTFWIDPTGKQYKVPGTHTAWVGRNVEKLNKKFGYDLPLGLNEQGGHQYTDILLDKGWVRILGTPGNAQFVIDVKDLSNIPPSVDNFIAEHFRAYLNMPIWIGTGNDMLVIKDPFPNIQDAVNKELQQKRMGSKAFSKKEIVARTSSNAWLMDPKGKLYPVINGDHEETAVKLTGKSTYDLLPLGWVTLRTVGKNLIVAVNNLHSIPSTVDNFLAQNTFNRIEVIPADETEAASFDILPYVTYDQAIEDGIQKALNKELIRMSKTAEQKSSMIEYACVMGDVPKEISQEIVEFGVRNIKDEDLYTENNLGRELDSHITIKYGIISDDSKQVEKLFKNIKPFKATLGEVKHFSPPERDFDVLTVSVESKDLSDMNEKITKEVKCATGLPSDEYHPHITIAYIKKGTCKNLYGNKEFVGKEITIDSVEFSPVKGDKSTIELGNKKEAAYRGNMDCWLASDGKEYSVTRSHTAWIVDEANLLKQQYGLTLPAEGSPEDDNLIAWLLSKGWTRVSGVLPVELDLLIQDINNIPQAAEQFVWKYKPEVVIVEDLNGNDVSFDREEYSKGMMKKASSNIQEINGVRVYRNPTPEQAVNLLKQSKEHALRYITTDSDIYFWDAYYADHKPMAEEMGLTEDPNWYDNAGTAITEENAKDKAELFTRHSLELQPTAKIAEFLPSLFPAPDNKWTPDSDKEIALNPDAVSDDETLYGEWWQDKPRNQNAWAEFISMFKQPMSKKENMTIDSAYDPEFEEIERKELGEDETLNDFSKGMYDPKKHDFPHNTTFDSILQDMEPSKPGMAVTYSPESNDAFLDQNGPDGTPRRFMGRPKGEFSSTSGEAIDTLIHMFKNKKASIEFPLAGSSVDGRTVRNEVPNQSSIGASLDDYTILKGIREVPFSAFTQMPALSYYSADEEKRTKELAEQIKQTSEITPLIIAVDNQGPYILEGGHRFDALRELGANSFPAMVVLDNESLNREAAINSLTVNITASYTHAYWLDPNGKVFQVRGENEDELIKSLNRSDTDTHSAWILRNLDMLQKDYGIDPKNLSGTSRSLVELGWTRIGDAYGTDWGIDVTNTDNIPSFIDDVIAQFAPEGAKITVAGPGSSRYAHSQSGYTFEWPVKSIQQTVNRIKQRGQYYQDKPVMAAVIDSLTRDITAGSYGFGGWVSPNGEFIKTKDHYGFVYKHPEVFGLKGTDVDTLAKIQEQAPNIINSGWIRIRSWGDSLLVQARSFEDAKKSEEQIFEVLDDIKSIKIMLPDEHNYEATSEEFKEKGWDAFSKQVPVMAKKAELIDFQAPNGLTFPVLLNPSKQEFLGAVKKYGIVRLLKGGNGIYVWDANEMTHLDMVKALRALGYEDAENYFPKKGYTSKSVGDKVTIEDENGHWVDISIDELLSNQLVMAKQALHNSTICDILKVAGDQSTCYTDEQMDSWKNEQIHDMGGEEEYVTHQQRDYPYGMNDSPENTGYNIGWPETENRYTVYLDQIQNPADRNFPPGLMNYDVEIYFNSAPSDGGIEKQNPD